MLNLMEGIVPEYDRKGKVASSCHFTGFGKRLSTVQIRGPSGSSVTGIVLTNAYPCLPSPSAPSGPAYVVIGANGDTLYNKLMKVIERPDLTGPLYLNNNHRVERQAEIEEAISAWTSRHTVEDAERIMMGAGVPVGRANSVKEIVEWEQVKARGAIEDVWVGDEQTGWNVKMPKVFPLLEGCDSQTRWAGPELGQHTEEVLLGDLGLDENEFARLKDSGIIG